MDLTLNLNGSEIKILPRMHVMYAVYLKLKPAESLIGYNVAAKTRNI